MSDVADLKKLQNDAKQLAKPLTSLAQVKLTSPEGLGEFQSLLAKLPAPATWSLAVEEFQNRATKTAKTVADLRKEGFRRVEAEFIRGYKGPNGSPVQNESGWRVGPVQLVLQHESSRAQVLYNRAEVIKWRSIGDAADLSKLIEHAAAALDKWRIAESVRADVFLRAALEAHRRREVKSSAKLIPIRDWLAEVRVELARRDLQSGYGARIKFAEFPTYAALYNIDLYRSTSASLPANHRLGFEAGSQAEASKGVLANGLRPTDQYKLFCYVSLPPGSEK